MTHVTERDNGSAHSASDEPERGAFRSLAPLPVGTVVAVGGAGSGMGRAVAEAFGRAGALVELLDISPAALHATTEHLRSLGVEASGFVGDGSEEESVRDFYGGISERHGRLSTLVNSIGVQAYGTAETTTVDEWDRVTAVNVRSIFLMAKYAIPLLRRNGGGSIVNISSVQALATQQNVVAYAASKGAVAAMSRAMAMDHAKEHIRVNVVLPGSIDTPLLRAAARGVDATDPDRVIAEWGSGHPVGRVGLPEDVAAACVYLASPGADFITGAELRVDGGLTAGLALVAPRAD